MTRKHVWKSARRRNVLLGLAAAVSIWIASAAIADPPDGETASRWAVVASAPLRDAGVSDLLVAELSSLEGVELVEREAIDRIQEELKLTAAGLVDPNKAVQLGELLTEKPSGVGLGLPLARRILQGLGGRIAVDSEPGNGALFTLVLPLSAQTAPRPT